LLYVSLPYNGIPHEILSRKDLYFTRSHGNHGENKN
jgi:hypothetical protein